MIKFDVGIAYTWYYDEDFIALLKEELIKSKIKFILINYHNYKLVSELIQNKIFSINIFWDRATDDDINFEIISKQLINNSLILNDYDKIHFSSDKATMHLELISHGLNTPFTIIISPFNSEQEVQLKISDLANLGRPFIIKPANTTGGGTGVVLGAETLNDILHARQTHKFDKYLLQKKIEPKILDNKRFWFRCFWAFNKIIITWWNDITHIYEIATEEDIKKYNLSGLFEYIKKIHQICQLNFFSSEIAMTVEDRFVVIDYVNDMCDLRLKSKHPDGIPDSTVLQFIDAFVNFIKVKNENTK